MIRLVYAFAIVLLLGLLSGPGAAQDEEPKPKTNPRRFGFDLDAMTYPQKSPQETLKSIALALGRKKVDYMLAHLVDPNYVDYWVERYKMAYTKGREEAKSLLAFDRLVAETNRYYLDDPLILKDLRVFAKEAEWDEKENLATGTAKASAGRKMFMRRIGERWFLENRQQETPAPK